MKCVRIDLVRQHLGVILIWHKLVFRHLAPHKLAGKTLGGLEVGQVLPLQLLQLDDLGVLARVLVHKVLFSWDPAIFR